MNNPIVVDLFVEDKAHEEFMKAMLNRIAKQEKKTIIQRVRTARGGHGRVQEELSLYQKSLKGGMIGNIPDILFIAIDANCKRFHKAKTHIESKIETDFAGRAIIACPDPHIERWYLSDLVSFAEVVGVRPRLGKKKCERDRYKTILSKAIKEAGYPPTLGGIEFAQEIVDNMDFYRAGKAENSLKNFLDDAISKIRSL